MELFTLLAQHPTLLIATVFLFGLMLGSFLNVVAYRLPVMMERDWKQQCVEYLHPDQSADQHPQTTERFSLIVPRSRCPACGHTITALENIPVLSYLFLRGKCSACSTHISLRYPIVEFVTALLSAVVAWKLGWGWPLAAGLVFTWALIALTLIDFDHKLLPDSITLPLLWLGLLLSLSTVFVDMRASIIGAAAGYLSLWSVYQVFRLVTGKEGMGFGDFKLLAAIGAWLGWQALPVTILLSSLVGAIVGIGLIVIRGRDRDRNIPIPFGPYIAAAGWLAMLWGKDITDAYLRYVGLA
ncbi:MAG: prepilin peptidase [Gammaproteobacteria bacterium]|nr:prepilin peptidase [Gammaproteobacteria bacterium]